MRILFLTHEPKPTSERSLYDAERIGALLSSYASPGTTVELGYPEESGNSSILEVLREQSVLNGLHHMLQVPALVRKILWAEHEGYDAVIQSNTFDPGVEAARLAVKIPVIGLLRTSLHVALTLADRVGITVPLDSHVPYAWRLLRSYGLDRFVSEVVPMGMYGQEVVKHPDQMAEHMLKLIRSLVEEHGAEVILPLGGALIPYVIDPADLQAASGVQVLNTKAIGIRFAELCVELGLAHSGRAYPRPLLDYQQLS